MRSLTLAQSGLLLLLAGSAVDSTSGLFTRLLPTDGFTTASGRGLAAFAFLLVVLAVRDGRGTLRSLVGVGIWGLVFVVLNSVGMILNILSLSLTSVANFFIIFATAPFIAALGARLVLGERMDRATFLAAIAGFVGIAVMMFAGARSGGLLGDLLALTKSPPPGAKTPPLGETLALNKFPPLPTSPRSPFALSERTMNMVLAQVGVPMKPQSPSPACTPR
jgi:drug/metabolite transporter (DMT)-like permease